MKHYRLEAEAAVEFDIEAAFEWYEAEEPNLGFEFLEQLRTAYQHILPRSPSAVDIRIVGLRVMTTAGDGVYH